MDVARWLRGLGLEQYEQVFRDNDIDSAVLPSLTAEDLKELGIASVGHRLVGSTELSTKIDPEDLREVIAAYHRGVAETVSRFAGFVAKYMGDGGSSISATHKPMRTTPSGRYVAGSP